MQEFDPKLVPLLNSSGKEIGVILSDNESQGHLVQTTPTCLFCGASEQVKNSLLCSVCTKKNNDRMEWEPTPRPANLKKVEYEHAQLAIGTPVWSPLRPGYITGKFQGAHCDIKSRQMYYEGGGYHISKLPPIPENEGQNIYGYCHLKDCWLVETL